MHTAPIDILPPELLKAILVEATPEGADIDSDYGPDFMDNYTWVFGRHGEWIVRPPQESANVIERFGYRTKTAIAAVNKLWNRLGTELLYKSLLLERPDQLGTLVHRLSEHRELGWWTQRITVHPYIPSSEAASSGVADCLQVLFHLCPNLQDVRLTCWFHDVHTVSICTSFVPALQHIRWTIPRSCVATFVHVLSQLRSLECLELSVEEQEGYRETDLLPILGSMPRLRQLSLQGQLAILLRGIKSWRMPRLTDLSFTFLADAPCQKLANDLVSAHIHQLTSLTLNTVSPWDVATILSKGFNLSQISFNPDWPLPRLVDEPHPGIQAIGLHGLWYGFEVGPGEIMATRHPARAAAIRTSNDRNIRRITRQAFPNLHRVRVLDSKLLLELHRAGGPSPRQIVPWRRWMENAMRNGYTIEDCTGNLIGSLPATRQDPYEDSYEDYYDYEEEGSDSEEEESDGEYDEEDEEAEVDELLQGELFAPELDSSAPRIVLSAA